LNDGPLKWKYRLGEPGLKKIIEANAQKPDRKVDQERSEELLQEKE